MRGGVVMRNYFGVLCEWHEVGSATQVMLATRFRATVGQKHHHHEGGPQQPVLWPEWLVICDNGPDAVDPKSPEPGPWAILAYSHGATLQPTSSFVRCGGIGAMR